MKVSEKSLELNVGRHEGEPYTFNYKDRNHELRNRERHQCHLSRILPIRRVNAVHCATATDDVPTWKSWPLRSASSDV